MSETFEVAGILGKRINKGVVEYRIEWKGYSIEDATWEPVDSLSSIKGIIEAYEAKSSKNGKGLFQSDSKRGKLKDKVDEKRRTYKKSTKSQSKDDSSEYDDSKIEEQPRTRNKNIARRSNTPPRFARRSGTPSPENAKPDTESFTIKLSEKLKKSNKLGDSKKEEEEANRARAERASRRIEVYTSKKDECSEEEVDEERVEVLKMVFKQGEGRRVMEVRMGDKIKELSLEEVRASHSKALCLYYEKILRIDP